MNKISNSIFKTLPGALFTGDNNDDDGDTKILIPTKI